MSTAAVIVVAFLAAVVFLGATVAWSVWAPKRRDGAVRSLFRERFVVSTLTGETFDGVLLDADERSLVLTQVSTLGADGSKLPVDGQLVLPRSRIAYVQKP